MYGETTFYIIRYDVVRVQRTSDGLSITDDDNNGPNIRVRNRDARTRAHENSTQTMNMSTHAHDIAVRDPTLMYVIIMSYSMSNRTSVCSVYV